MRAAIVEQLCAGAPTDMVAGARALIDARGNLTEQLVALGFAARDVIEACSDVTGLPIADASWLAAPRPPPAIDGLDPILCRRLQAAPVAAMGGRLCIAYADPEMAAQHRELGLPPHAPYLALPAQLSLALTLLPQVPAGLSATQLAPTADNELVPSTAPQTASAAPTADDGPPTALARPPRTTPLGEGEIFDIDDRPPPAAVATTLETPPAAVSGASVGLSSSPPQQQQPKAMSGASPTRAPAFVLSDKRPAAAPTPSSARSAAPLAASGPTPATRGPVTTSRMRAAPPSRVGFWLSGAVLVVALAAFVFVIARHAIAPDVGVAARLRTEAAPASGVALEQHELTLRSIDQQDPAQAIALLTQALALDGHGREERDALLERARRELERAGFDAAEGDLLRVARRADRSEIERELAALLDAVGRGRVRHKRAHPTRGDAEQ